MNTLPAIPALPESLLADGVLRPGLWAGDVSVEALPSLPGRGRERRWFYSAFAAPDGSLAFGAAVVSLGLAGTAFAWALLDGEVVDTSRRLFGRRKSVGQAPSEGAQASARRQERWPLTVLVSDRGDLTVRAADLGGRAIELTVATVPDAATRVADRAAAPVVCSTPTPGGGCNVTQKAAGHAARATVDIDGERSALDGFGWYDWTRGRQDRRTHWRWAAGAGRATDGRSVGLNLSTGMNEATGENIVWVDGAPMVVDVTRLAPTVAGEFGGSWRIEGPGWGLDFEPRGVRAADENLLVVRSHYVQPVGMFRGSLPSPGGGTVAVEFPGVTEDHGALW